MSLTAVWTVSAAVNAIAVAPGIQSTFCTTKMEWQCHITLVEMTL